MTSSSDRMSVIDKAVDAFERPVETGRYAESGPNGSFNDGLNTARDAIIDALEGQPAPIDAFLPAIPPRITTLAGRGGLREWVKTYRQAEAAAKRRPAPRGPAAHEVCMTHSTLTAPAALTATARGLIVGATLLAVGIALGIYRFVTLSASTDSAFLGHPTRTSQAPPAPAQAYEEGHQARDEHQLIGARLGRQVLAVRQAARQGDPRWRARA